MQYAHARLSALARNAADLGLKPDTAHLDLLGHDKEGTLIRSIGEFPRVLQSAAALREPHRVCRYLEDLAGDYHRFYDACRVLPQGDEDPTDLHRARLALCDATRRVIANGLGILGVSAPERMSTSIRPGPGTLRRSTTVARRRGRRRPPNSCPWRRTSGPATSFAVTAALFGWPGSR